MSSLIITRPDDLHLHVRDNAAMASVVGDSARRFARAVIMPNLKPPVVSVEQAMAYRQRILAALPADSGFRPLMTLYLTDNTTPADIDAAADCEEIVAVKYYPAGATTHSDDGVTAIDKVYPVLERMADSGVPLLMHGEVTDAEVDIFDRESVFIDDVLDPLLRRYPGLKVVFEHITTRQAVQYVSEAGGNLAATITPQHLMYNRNALFRQGLRPHHFCLPVLKRESHRRALINAAIGGHPRFFLGTDSAPHPRGAKESACGCAGIYSAHGALELYAEVFEAAGALDRLEAFAAFHGADFYGLPRNGATVTLEKRDWTVPEALPFGDEEVVPLKAGETCSWQLVEA
ncbi:MAG: dihydroorotase [Gammaproteobacteria bacterium]